MTLHSRVRVAIVDPMCAAGYDPSHLRTGTLGGTEATTLRIADALSETFKIGLFQRNRRTTSQRGSLSFERFEVKLTKLQTDVIVVINAWKVALKLRRINPDLPIFLWLHVFPGRHNRVMGKELRDAGIRIICVSQSHADGLRRFLAEARQPDILHIHNPVADSMVPDATPRLKNRLLFASSPHKGLREVFACFDALRHTIPELVLAVADPGYLRWNVGPAPDNVIPLGVLSHTALIRQMRRSLCVFYPQTTFAETFGLVMAEANAVGTPVLAQKGLGANNEVLESPDQRIDCSDPTQILERIQCWRQRAPEVSLNPSFRLSAVAHQWADLLTSAARSERLETSQRVA
ncbi:hypothetical protein P775_16535 [Puniceibacterium antarcticum]|uniref:Glycosyl transferase family 1 domain-containing protein n=1 Tax=Puniceibacterium antarcticum TaxID=1206336 RepID=A0A2G8RBW6_9RHOB|nr:glycosyltransferase [Puniceibacterium antarcticum]PIL19049.1 hypothetical protein P775_16535 [Puniceibacterium antarcticum]